MSATARWRELNDLEAYVDQKQFNSVNMLLKALAAIDSADLLLIRREWDKIEALSTELVERLDDLRHTEEE